MEHCEARNDDRGVQRKRGNKMEAKYRGDFNEGNANLQEVSVRFSIIPERGSRVHVTVEPHASFSHSYHCTTILINLSFSIQYIAYISFFPSNVIITALFSHTSHLSYSLWIHVNHSHIIQVCENLNYDMMECHCDVVDEE